MARRFRNFKRVKMSAPVARFIARHLVDWTFERHGESTLCTFCTIYASYCTHCKNSGSLKWCDVLTCAVTHYIPIEVASLLEVGLKISKTRAHLDLPDDPVLLEELSAGLNRFLLAFRNNASQTRIWEATKSKVAEIITAAEEYRRRGPLERLAEAAE